MTDPFDALREPLVPLDPRPEFARQLRQRLALELAEEEQQMPTLEVREYTPARLHSITPYLALGDPKRAIEWYTEVFGATLLGDPIVMPDGTIGHAEMRIGDSVFMLAGEFPEERHLAPTTLGGSSAAFMVHVPDSDRTYARAVELGATALRPVQESYGARQGTLIDPFGHRWMIATALGGRRRARRGRPRPSLRRPRLPHVGGRRRRARRTVLLTVVRMGPRPERRAGLVPHLVDHSAGGHPRPRRRGDPEFKIYFRVDDIDAVAARVRELGGQVLSINSYDSGGNAECVDDQGLRFELFRPRAGYDVGRPFPQGHETVIDRIVPPSLGATRSTSTSSVDRGHRRLGSCTTYHGNDCPNARRPHASAGALFLPVDLDLVAVGVVDAEEHEVGIVAARDD